MGRIIHNMDLAWRFHPGDYVAPGEGANSHQNSYASCKAGAAGSGAAVSLSCMDWQQVDLPHDYYAASSFSPDNLLSHGYRTRGNAWYRKSFVLDEAYRGKQLLLCFEGTAVNAEFYFNGSLMARSFSAYTETVFDITDRAHFGKNTPNELAVYINGMATEGWWYEGAGIYRHVRLYVKEPLHFAHNGIYAKPVLRPGSKNAWSVELECELENSAYTAQSGRVRAVLMDGDKEIAVSEGAELACPANSTVIARQRFAVKRPTRWDVDNPKLYTLRVTLEKDGEAADGDSVRIGFRTFSVDPEKGFFLNDRPLKIKGTCNHQDHAGVGVAVPNSVQYYRIRRLKEMGTNAYRCAHNLPTKEVLDACDELGLIVMDENRRFESREEVLQYIDIMVRRDRNHPSVIFWSLFNEEPLQNTDEGARMYRRMRARVEKWDRTRLITGAINGNMEGAGMEMDVTGINYGIGAIDGFHARHPEQPIIGSENNSAVTTRGCYRTDNEAHVLANYDEEKVPWGQTVRETWRFTRARDYFCGIFIWTGFDYRGEPTPYTWPSVSSQFGIMDTCGFPKDSFYYNKACFTDKPMVHLLPHWNWQAGDIVRVAAPTNCEEVELFLNGRSLGRRTGDCCDTPEWEVPFERGRLTARAYRGGKCVARDEVRTAGKPYAIRMTADRTSYRNDGEDTAVFDLAVVDRRGVVVPTATHHLTFTVPEGGYVRGVGNGDPNSHASDVLPERDLYAGHCQALVTVKRGAGRLVFRAEGKGLLPAELTLPVETVKEPDYIFEAVGGYAGNFTMTAVLDERPDPLMQTADNDMNTFMPITFSPTSHQGDFHNGWRIYRTTVRLPQDGHCRVVFPNLIADEIEVYVGGQKIHESHTPFNGQVSGEEYECPFENTFGEKAELRILIRMIDAPWGGIRGGVLIYGE